MGNAIRPCGTLIIVESRINIYDMPSRTHHAAIVAIMHPVTVIDFNCVITCVLSPWTAALDSTLYLAPRSSKRQTTETAYEKN